MSKGSVLVVEDEEKIARLLELELEYEGYTVKKVMNGKEGLSVFGEGKWDMVLLDVMLPGMSGIELLRRIRAMDQVTPIILLTARDSVDDKISGLDLGANDYMTKPFQIEELLARIRVALRTRETEQAKESEDWLIAGDLKLNPNTREVTRGKEEISLTKREFDLLQYLMKNKRQVLTREQILEAVWGFDFAGETNVVDVYVRYLRKKIDSPNRSSLLHTIRGVGYCLKEAK